MASKVVAAQSSATIFHNSYEAPLKDLESNVPLGFFSQIAKNYLTTTNSNHSMAQSIEIKFILILIILCFRTI